MPDLVDAIEAEICSYVLGELPSDPSGELTAKPVRDLLIIYGNWRGRFVEARPRTVHRSKQLDASAAATARKADLDVLVDKIEAGDDLKPHLSTAVETAFVSTPEQAGGASYDRALDRMLADWGIHHLHLSSAPGPRGFTRRGGDLLFAMYRPDDAYLIGIYPHGVWALQELIEVIVDNWPDAGLVHEFQYILPSGRNPTDADRQAQRAAGISGSLIEIDGRLYGMSAIGMTASGTPMLVTIRVQNLMWRLWDLRENLAERLAQFSAVADEKAGRQLTGDWTPAVREGSAGLLREDVFVQLGPLG
jgi:hypothetical protein